MTNEVETQATKKSSKSYQVQEKKGRQKPDLVVQSNRYINYHHKLTKSEVRILEVAIVDARETEQGLSTDSPLKLTVKRYAERFGLTWEAAYGALLEASETLIKKQYEYPHPKYPDNPKKNIKSNYLQDFSPMADEGYFELTFTRSVIEEITRLDGKKMPYTQYFLEQTAKMKSVYSIRLFQILSAWRKKLSNTGKPTPIYKIEEMRLQLGIEPEEYERMYDFKTKILDIALREINKKTDMGVDYIQVKQGRKIAGFKFLLRDKDMSEDIKKADGNEDKELYYYVFKSEKQLNFVASLLSNLHAIVGNREFKTYQEATKVIATELMNKEKQQQYIPYIENNEEFKDVKLKQKKYKV